MPLQVLAAIGSAGVNLSSISGSVEELTKCSGFTYLGNFAWNIARNLSRVWEFLKFKNFSATSWSIVIARVHAKPWRHCFGETCRLRKPGNTCVRPYGIYKQH